MASRAIQALVASNRDVPRDSPKPTQDCRDVIHIMIFFDGTGNNEKLDNEKKKWSNVARIYQAAYMAALADKNETIYPVYIAGVGTKFNGKAADWQAATLAWIEDGLPGGGAGAGGSRRMEHAGDFVNDTLRDTLISNAKLLGVEVEKYTEQGATKTFNEVNSVLSKHRLIKIINLSVFGFSRGAALARAFSNRILKLCVKDGDDLMYEGYPLRINFMGLFDTVASFGIPATNARTPFSDRELIVSSLVERCVHFVAAHEVRFSFPVDLIRKNGRLAGNWLEKVYPGVHSDVGGGYEPLEQGIDDNYARIPMRDMMDEALVYGVRIFGYDTIKKKSSRLFVERFAYRPETEKMFISYMAALPRTGGTVEEQIKTHMGLYYSINGSMARQGVATAGDRSRNANKLKYIFGSKGMEFEIGRHRKLLRAGQLLRLGERNARGYAQYLEIKDWQLAAWDRNAPQGAIDFIASFVHDSKVDFMGNVEPFSYFRPRGVEESCISVWAEGGNWIRPRVKAAISVAEAGSAKIAGVAEEAVVKARKSAEAAQEKALEAAEFAKIKASEAAAAASSAYAATAKSAKEAADAAKHRAQEAADYAKKKASEAAQISEKAYTTARQSTMQTVTEAKRKTSEWQNGAQKMVEGGIRWVCRSADELHNRLK